MTVRIVLLLTASIFLVSRPASAADFSKKIPAGSSYADVLSLWGEPVEKVEEGVLKQTIWYFKDGAKVLFKEGRVRSFRSTNAVIAQQSALDDAKAQEQQVSAEVAGETRDLVRDIAKEVPSGPDVPFVEPPSGGQNPIIPNPIPPGGRPSAPVIVPADDVLEEDQ